MKATKTCPKCGSKSVTYKKGSSNSYSGKFHLSIWRSAKLERYICLDCAFFEEYIIKDKSFLKWSEKQKKNIKPNLDDDFVDFV